MAGNTATISIESFRRDWGSHIPMRALATRYTITRDQVVRLAVVWNLPRRHDRRLRHRPEVLRDPTEEEIWGAGGLTSQIQATWNDFQREQRRVTKLQSFNLPTVETPDDVRQWLDDWNEDAER